MHTCRRQTFQVPIQAEKKQVEITACRGGPQGFAERACPGPGHVLAMPGSSDEFAPELSLAPKNVLGLVGSQLRGNRFECVCLLERYQPTNGQRLLVGWTLVVIEIGV